MTHYVEQFKILDRQFGIEDYKDGRGEDDHFMPTIAKREKWPRFKLWVGGGGFGSAKTITEARQKTHDYAVEMTSAKLKEAERVVAECKRTLKLLGEDPAFLFRFDNSK